MSGIFRTSEPFKGNPLVHELENDIRAFKNRLRGRVTFALKNPGKLLARRLIDTSQSRSARRWRPVVVLIHLGQEGRSTIYTLITGYVEAMLLLILTFFFAAQWGGNLYVTFITLTILLLFVTASRALSVIYVMISSRFWGLHIVHCGSHNEIMGTLRIICSMKGFLVVINGATYYDGYKVNGRPKVGDKTGFEEWMRGYDKGDYDYDYDEDEKGDFDEDEKGDFDEEEETSREDQRPDNEEASQPMLRV